MFQLSLKEVVMDWNKVFQKNIDTNGVRLGELRLPWLNQDIDLLYRLTVSHS